MCKISTNAIRTKKIKELALEWYNKVGSGVHGFKEVGERVGAENGSNKKLMILYVYININNPNLLHII